jgi:hypothetical protein
LKGTSSFLVAIGHYIGGNIKKSMSLILETCDLVSSFVSLGSIIQKFREYLQYDLINDKGFYKDEIIKFSLKVSFMSELNIKEEYLSSPTYKKQLKECWMKIINTLKELLDDLDILSVKKGEYYSKIMRLDLVGTIGEVQDPKLISNRILLTIQQFEENVEILKCIFKGTLEKYINI